MDFVDEDEEADPEWRRLTNSIIGAAIAVHRELGPGHVESVYANALELEFRARSIPYAREHRFKLLYRGEAVGVGRVDFLVEQTVIVEVKSVEVLASIHVAQALSYMKATGKKLGLVINFNAKMLKDGVRRISLRQGADLLFSLQSLQSLHSLCHE